MLPLGKGGGIGVDADPRQDFAAPPEAGAMAFRRRRIKGKGPLSGLCLDLRLIGVAFVHFTGETVGRFCLWTPRWGFVLLAIRSLAHIQNDE
jgi:hypothetical protein